MNVTIDLMEPLTEYAKEKICAKNKFGESRRFSYVVNIGGIVKHFSREAGAMNYLKKLGYKFQMDGTYARELKSEDEINLDRHFKKL